MKNNSPIGVFDSGVGGLSILIELKRLLSEENFVFLADQKYVPYGEKNKKELVRRVYKITDYFIKHYKIKMIVVACNTATCYTIDELRKKYPFPIVGTLPAVKPAAKLSKTKQIAVISTPSTSKSKMLKKLIKDNCRNIDVLNIGCKNLENVVEQGKLNNAQTHKLLLKYLRAIKNSDTDYLVLGCTHYPFLRKHIQKILGSRIKLIDGGNAIARRTKWWLKTKRAKNKEKGRRKTVYLTTGNSAKFSKLAGGLLKNRVRGKKINI
ncbi:glutamate racemase [Candidatus Nomurabacteria bacterium RIFCSPHIGHO2_01_FULL_38_19]|uniref:Glutamate racemase n=1 Tax=Candidatus Nomurabacteria bacterium RIFCSPHIGHO2_01_FULL_38_19 TaxID=1801732 RepID=A0A1F6UV02_9BACT|nr:MAG: glutamate racemase [Candidatus Nomurabacteria bacterium RIFCSPHIGHO2_01_FULL_38_19]